LLVLFVLFFICIFILLVNGLGLTSDVLNEYVMLCFIVLTVRGWVWSYEAWFILVDLWGTANL